jgi:hypothetical protein
LINCTSQKEKKKKKKRKRKVFDSFAYTEQSAAPLFMLFCKSVWWFWKILLDGPCSISLMILLEIKGKVK